MREAWTDERLDDLQNGMHREFDQVRAEAKREFALMRVEIRSSRAESKAEIGELRTEMNARFGEMNSRFDGMQRTLVLGFGSIVASVVGAVFVAALTHL